MAIALQQQVFALDARYNAYRGLNTPNFRTLYIRRRSQLLRETQRDSECWKQYIKLRSTLLQFHYGASNFSSTTEVISSSCGDLSQTVSRVSKLIESPVLETQVVPTNRAEASKALVGGNTIAENYSFVGVHHIFDQHSSAVTMVKFANNDRSKICCSSFDCSLSICDVAVNPPCIVGVLKGHTKAVSGFDWSANNDLIVSASVDGSIRVWDTTTFICLQTVLHPNNAALLCCIFQPANNNLLVAGSNRGDIRVANISLGRFIKRPCRIGGRILSLAADTDGKVLWVGNDKGEITSVLCDISGNLYRSKKISTNETCMVTNLSYRAWISREARDPLLLVNSSNNSLLLFSICDTEGELQLKRRFLNNHREHMIRSTFCPIMSFRQGACVVTGSEDGAVYFLDIEKHGHRTVVNTLQGHSSAVLGISFSYDESLLATCDFDGLVIVWRRANIP